MLCVNEVEACALAGTETFEADAVLTLLHEKYPQTRLLLTAGSAGSYYLDAERRLFVPCEKVQAVDTTAAVDTYSGYFLAGLCSGRLEISFCSTSQSPGEKAFSVWSICSVVIS